MLRNLFQRLPDSWWTKLATILFSHALSNPNLSYTHFAHHCNPPTNLNRVDQFWAGLYRRSSNLHQTTKATRQLVDKTSHHFVFPCIIQSKFELYTSEIIKNALKYKRSFFYDIHKNFPCFLPNWWLVLSTNYLVTFVV